MVFEIWKYREKHHERTCHQYPLFVDDAATLSPEDDGVSLNKSDVDERRD